MKCIVDKELQESLIYEYQKLEREIETIKGVEEKVKSHKPLLEWKQSRLLQLLQNQERERALKSQRMAKEVFSIYFTSLPFI